MTTTQNDLSAVIEADRAHLWHHLIQHKPFESIDPRIIVEGKGAHFDPDVVDAFIQRYDRFTAIAREHAE